MAALRSRTQSDYDDKLDRYYVLDRSPNADTIAMLAAATYVHNRSAPPLRVTSEPALLTGCLWL